MKKIFIFLLLSFFVVKGFIISAEEKINNKNSIYGYRIKNVKKTKDETINGIIEIYGNKYSFSDLKYSEKTGMVSNEIKLKDGNKDAVIETDFSGYGKKITYKELKITPDGIFAEAYVPLQNEKDKKYAVRFDSVKLNSEGKVETKNILEKTITYGTFKIKAEEIDFDGSKITVKKGRIDVSNKDFTLDERDFIDVEKSIPLNEILLDDFSFNYNKMLSECSVKDDGLSFKIDGWQFGFNERPVLTSEGIKGNCCIYKDDLICFYITFPEFILKADNTINSGKSEDEDSRPVFIKDYTLYTLKNVCFIKNSENKYVLKSENPELEIYTYNEDIVYLGETVIDSDGQIISSKKKNQPEGTKFYSANGYLVMPQTVELTDKGVKMSGTIYDEELKSKSSFDSDDFILSSDFVVETKMNDSATIDYEYNGWKIHGSGVKKSYDSVNIKNNIINFRGQEINLGQFKFNSVNELDEHVNIHERNIPISALSSDYSKHDSVITDTSMSYDYGLIVRMSVTLPEPLEKCTIKFDEVFLNPENGLYVKTIKNAAYFNITDNFYGELRDIILGDSFGIRAGYFILTLPPLNEGDDSASIKFEGFEVSEVEGKVIAKISGFSDCAFVLEKTTFIANNFHINDDGYNFSGYIILPGFLPKGLNGEMISLDSFNINRIGEITGMECKYNGYKYVKYNDEISFNLLNPSLNIEQNGVRKELVLSFDEVTMYFPREVRRNVIKVHNVKYNISNNEWDFSEIETVGKDENEIMDLKRLLLQE